MAETCDNPTISVIVPAYNAEAYIRETISSLLNQTYESLEIIIVDDGSTDGTPAMLEHYATNSRIRLLRQANAGVSAARNLALSQARGQWIGFLDADDLWDPEMLRRQTAMISPDVDILHANSRVINGAGRVTREAMNYQDHIGRPTLAEQIACNRVLLNTVLVRAEKLRAVGGFDIANRLGAQDFELWLMLLADGAKAAYTNEVLASYRVHGENYSLNRDRNHLAQMFGLRQLKKRYPNAFGPEEKRVWRRRMSELSFDAAWHRFHNQRFRDSAGLFFNAARYGPWRVKYKVLGYLLFCGLPCRGWLFRKIKGSRS